MSYTNIVEMASMDDIQPTSCRLHTDDETTPLTAVSNGPASAEAVVSSRKRSRKITDLLRPTINNSSSSTRYSLDDCVLIDKEGVVSTIDVELSLILSEAKGKIKQTRSEENHIPDSRKSVDSGECGAKTSFIGRGDAVDESLNKHTGFHLDDQAQRRQSSSEISTSKPSDWDVTRVDGDITQCPGDAEKTNWVNPDSSSAVAQSKQFKTLENNESDEKHYEQPVKVWLVSKQSGKKPKDRFSSDSSEDLIVLQNDDCSLTDRATYSLLRLDSDGSPTVEIRTRRELGAPTVSLLPPGITTVNLRTIPFTPVGFRFPPISVGDVKMCKIRRNTSWLMRRLLSLKCWRKWETHCVQLEETHFYSTTVGVLNFLPTG